MFILFIYFFMLLESI